MNRPVTVMGRASSTDSASSSSILSCIEVRVAGSNGREFGVDSSSTPPTSVSESSSGPLEVAEGSKDKDPERRRSGRSRSSIGTYNDNVNSGTAVHTRKAYLKGASDTHGLGSRTVSGVTLVNDENNNIDSPREKLLKDSVDALNMDWDLIRRPGSSRPGRGVNAKINKRQSARLGVIADAASSAVGAVASATSVLGKRGRDALENAKDKLQDLNRRSSLRSKDPKQPPLPSKDAVVINDSPAKKKQRMFPNLALPAPEDDNEKDKENEPPTPKKAPRKFWLSTGLYVGQVRDAPLRTPKKNKRDSGASTLVKERVILPMPMFHGEKTLEKGRDFKLPFDILNPLPRDQSPKDWRTLSKNRFIGDAAATWKKHNLPMSTCICTDENGCDDNCLNRNMQYECNESNCYFGNETCSNRSFGELKWRNKNKNATRNPTKRESNLWGEGVEVVQTGDRGYGVRAMRSFEPGQIIVEYTGEIITQDESDRRMNEDYKGKTDYYLMTFHDGMIIDATRGSICRFVNHSCNPNCRVEKWVVDGEPRMALFAGDFGLMSAEELTYDYNFDPYSKKNIQKCLCGSANCRGFLGPKTAETSKLQKAASTASNLVKGTKRKLKNVFGVDSNNSSPKKKKRRTTLADPIGLINKARKQISNLGMSSEQQQQQQQLSSHISMEIQKKSRADRAQRRSSSLITLKSKKGGMRSVGKRRSASIYSASSLASSPIRSRKQSTALLPLSKGKFQARSPKVDFKSVAASILKKGSAAMGSVKRNMTTKKSVGPGLSAMTLDSRSNSKTKLLGSSNSNLRQSKLSFDGRSLRIDDSDTSLLAEDNSPIQPTTKAGGRKGKMDVGNPNRPGTSARPATAHSMATSLKSVAVKSVRGPRKTAAMIRMGLKGEEGVRNTIRTVSGA